MKFRLSNNICRIACLSALVLSLAGIASAQKLAMINMQEAILGTPEGKAAAQQLEAKFAPVKADLDKAQADIVAKQDQLTKGKGTMSAAQQTALANEIDSASNALDRKRQDAQQDFQDEENKLLGAIVPKLQQAINAYAAANGINIVVDMGATPNNLIYGDAKLNITAQVLAAYGNGTAEAKPAAAPAATKPAAAPPAPKAAAPAAPKPPAPKPAAPAK